MKTLLKTLLALTLVIAFLLTGCETPDVSSGSSSNTNDASSKTSSEIIDPASSVVSEDNSVCVSSEDASFKKTTFSSSAEFAESDEAKDFVCRLGEFLGIGEVKSVEEYGVYPFAVYSTLIQVGDEAFNDYSSPEIDMKLLENYLEKHFGSSDFEIDNRLFWNQASNHPDSVYIRRSIEIDEYGMQIACGYTAEVIEVEPYSEKAVYTLKLRDRFFSPDITAVVKMTFETHSEGKGHYYLKFLSSEVIESVYKNETLQSESSRQTALAFLKSAAENLNGCFENGRIQIEPYYCSSQLKINYTTVIPSYCSQVDNIAKKAYSQNATNKSFVFNNKTYSYSDVLGLQESSVQKNDFKSATKWMLRQNSSYLNPKFEKIGVSDITVLKDTEDTLIIQIPYYDYELLSSNRLLYPVRPEDQDELLTDSVTTVTIDKKNQRIIRIVMSFELDAKVQKLHNSQQYRYHMLVCDYGYDNIDLSDLELPS